MEEDRLRFTVSFLAFVLYVLCQIVINVVSWVQEIAINAISNLPGTALKCARFAGLVVCHGTDLKDM
jgi:hypothetical protein